MTKKLPLFIMTYGNSGTGKTTDCGYSFPNALFIANSGALHSVRNICGYEPSAVHCDTVEDIITLLTKMKQSNGQHKFDAIVIDDFAFMMEKSIGLRGSKKPNLDMRDWGYINKLALEFRKILSEIPESMGLHVILNCWEKPPKTTNEGHFIRGGAQLHGKLPEMFASLPDMVLRCGIDNMRKGWNGIYICSNDRNYATKDRLNICYKLKPIPMNLREILHAAGYKLSRHPTLSWQAEAVEAITAQLNDSTDPLSLANTLYSGLLEKGIAPTAARWTMRDALDRHVIQTALHQSDRTFI